MILQPDEEGPDTGVTDLESVREYLSGEDREELIEIVVAQAKLDDSLLRRLATDAFKRAVHEATSSMGFVEYGESYEFAAGVGDVVDEIENLLQDAPLRRPCASGFGAVEVVE